MSSKARAWKTIKTVFIFLLFIVFMLPFILVLGNSFKLNADIIRNPVSLFRVSTMTLQNYVKAFEQMEYVKAFANSLVITGISVVLICLVGSMAAYAFVRYKGNVSNLFFAMMVASMAISFQVLMIPIISIYGNHLHLLNHRGTLIYLNVGLNVSMAVFFYHGFIKSSIPVALEEAARIDGCGRIQIFFRIVLPLLKPITATLAVLNSLALWNDYLLPSMVLTKKKLYTLPLSTYSFYGTYSNDLGRLMAALVLTALPLIVLYLFLQRYVIDGVVAGAVK